MRAMRPLSLLLCIALRSTRAHTEMELTYENFDREVFQSNRSAAFIEFYTEGCRDCLLMEVGRPHME